MQQINAAPSPDVAVRPAPRAAQAPVERASDAAPATPAIPAIPAIPAVPAVPAIPAMPPSAATAPTMAKVWMTTQPGPDVWSMQSSFRDLVFSDGFQIASFLLVFPFAIALARRVWVRGGRQTTVVDLEKSPRLQRIEQAIESIAVEVERIGEAQRFTTKLLAEREPVAARIPSSSSSSRREPGTITPH